MTTRTEWQATGLLWAGGVLWPALYGGVAYLVRSPLERALYDSWCGAAPRTSLEFLGHCATCWSGAAAFMLAGALVLSFNLQRTPNASA